MAEEEYDDYQVRRNIHHLHRLHLGAVHGLPHLFGPTASKEGCAICGAQERGSEEFPEARFGRPESRFPEHPRTVERSFMEDEEQGLRHEKSPGKMEGHGSGTEETHL